MCTAVNSVINVGRWQTIATQWQPNGNNIYIYSFSFARSLAPNDRWFELRKRKNAAPFRNSIRRISHCHSCSGDVHRTAHRLMSGEIGVWWHFHKSEWTWCATVCRHTVHIAVAIAYTPIALRGIDIPVCGLCIWWLGCGTCYVFVSSFRFFSSVLYLLSLQTKQYQMVNHGPDADDATAAAVTALVARCTDTHTLAGPFSMLSTWLQ